MLSSSADVLLEQTPRPETWLNHSPAGVLKSAAPLRHRTWLKVGGQASLLFLPKDQDDLQVLLAAYPADAPLFCLGVGSNTLIRDGGLDALVVHLGQPFAQMLRLDSHRFLVGAGARSLSVARQAATWGLGGLSFLAGIPGSIGGALAMNAGAHGGETFDQLQAIHWIDRQGKLHHTDKADIEYGYRYCGLRGGVFVAAIFCCPSSSPDKLDAEIAAIQRRRQETQPQGVRTGGSTFKNPTQPSPQDGTVKSAWQWIDAAGCRGLRVGGAMMNEKHCNFMINIGTASATDLETLGETVRQRVCSHAGITLEWEIHRVGQPAVNKERNDG